MSSLKLQEICMIVILLLALLCVKYIRKITHAIGGVVKDVVEKVRAKKNKED